MLENGSALKIYMVAHVTCPRTSDTNSMGLSAGCQMPTHVFFMQAISIDESSEGIQFEYPLQWLNFVKLFFYLTLLT